MSYAGGRRKSTIKIISPNKAKVTGPTLKFKWSISAAHLAASEHNSSIILPTIAAVQPRKRVLTVSSLSTSSFH
jgi:hypothetical protein